MEQSPAISDILEPGWMWTRIRTSLERGVQHLARMSFGRSNRWSAAEFPYLPPAKNSTRSDGLNSRSLPISASLFGSVFCARTNLTRVHLLYERDSGHPVWRKFSYGVLCFILKHIPLILKVFLQYDLHHRAGVKPAQQSDDVSSTGQQPWSNIVGLVWHRRDIEVRIARILLILLGCVWE